MLSQPRALVPFSFERRTYKLYLLRVEFATDDAAPVSSPYVGEVGSLTIEDSDDVWAVAGGFAAPQKNNTVSEEPAAYHASGLARVTGRAFAARLKIDTSFAGGTAGNFFPVGWMSAAAPTGATQNVLTGFLLRGTAAGSTVADNGSLTLVPDALIALDTYVRVAVVARSSGALIFRDGVLVWVAVNGNYATLHAVVAERNTTGQAPPNVDFVRVRDLGSPFDSDYGAAVVHSAAVADASYSATANGIFDLTLTAPGSLAGAAGLKFRRNGGDYWRVHFDSAGDLVLQRYAADVAQGSPVTLASGVISGSATRRLRVNTNGSSMDFYTQAGTTWTKRGSTQTDSHLSANSGLSPFAESAWTSGGGSLGQIDGWARSSAHYDLLDSI